MQRPLGNIAIHRGRRVHPPLLVPLLAASSLIFVACLDESAPTQAGTAPTESVSPATAALVNSWSTKTRMPAGRFGHVAESTNNSTGNPLVYVFGGFEADPNLETDTKATVQVYDYRANSWSTKTPEPGGGLAYRNGIGHIGDSFYLPGGANSDPDAGTFYQKVMYRYDVRLDHWTRLADMPHGSGLGVSGVIDGKFFVLTGYETQKSLSNGQICEVHCPAIFTRRFYRYTPESNTWQSRPWCPNFHVSGASGVLNSKLYVVGGSTPSGIGRNLDIYDPATNKWTVGAALPAALTDITGVVVGAKLYVLGGRGADGKAGATYAYTPSTNSWSTRASMPTPRSHLAAARVALDGKAHIVTVGGSEVGVVVPTGTVNEVFTP
jgi:N-acetylneuraminic acid mutarotase